MATSRRSLHPQRKPVEYLMQVLQATPWDDLVACVLGLECAQRGGARLDEDEATLLREAQAELQRRAQGGSHGHIS